MAYWLVVSLLWVEVELGGEMHRTEFALRYETQAICERVMDKTEASLLARVETRALTISCQPEWMYLDGWDGP